ncbi:hypothetical protein BKA82DRAFT_1001702 [Pisolithus tinctorius]|uniref:Uncharacterized protein n=1 Tax=Pisolithus tinctorius Marx 270 TaxID=870435 RepID=A0A0C3K0D0_PISTI|nr:hypothetical protein BKA82DRAFT_1001702 [Pisolithus tinctorius]KIO03082.1 hypothetical protein M404DRAFT_1001702 [Pisolithus tinctorius Marx 270]
MSGPLPANLSRGSHLCTYTSLHTWISNIMFPFEVVVSIINFSTSIRLKSTRVRTKGYITPGSNAVIRASQLKPTCGVVGDLVFNLQAIP